MKTFNLTLWLARLIVRLTLGAMVVVGIGSLFFVVQAAISLSRTIPGAGVILLIVVGSGVVLFVVGWAFQYLRDEENGQHSQDN